MNTALVTLAILAASAPAPAVSETVRAGLDWLAKQQKPDGYWMKTNYDVPTRVTPVAGLALMMEGSTLSTGTYAPNLRKAVAWFEAYAAKTGSLSRNPGANDIVTRDHAHVIIFLASASDTDEDAERAARVAKLVNKAIADLGKAQTASGGWGVVLDNGGDSATSEWTADALHALFAARRLGFSVPKKWTDAGMDYLAHCTNRDGEVLQIPIRGAPPRGDGNRMSTFNTAAMALMTDGPRPTALPLLLRATFSKSVPQMREFSTGGTQVMLNQFHASRACFALGDRGHRDFDPAVPEADLVKWSAYRAKVFKALVDSRDKNGVWTDTGHGQTYPTALALIILQLDNGYIPAFTR